MERKRRLKKRNARDADLARGGMGSGRTAYTDRPRFVQLPVYHRSPYLPLYSSRGYFETFFSIFESTAEARSTPRTLQRLRQ